HPRRRRAARCGAQLLRQPAAGGAAMGPGFPARSRRSGDLRPRQAPAPPRGDDAAGVPAAGNRQPRPARLPPPGPAQRTRPPHRGAADHRRTPRPGPRRNRRHHHRQRRAPVWAAGWVTFFFNADNADKNRSTRIFQSGTPRTPGSARTTIVLSVLIGSYPRYPRPAFALAPFSRISRDLAVAAKAKAPVMWVAAPRPAPQSSLSAASLSRFGRMPQTLPSAWGYFTFSSEYTAGTPK